MDTTWKKKPPLLACLPLPQGVPGGRFGKRQAGNPPSTSSIRPTKKRLALAVQVGHKSFDGLSNPKENPVVWQQPSAIEQNAWLGFSNTDPELWFPASRASFGPNTSCHLASTENCCQKLGTPPPFRYEQQNNHQQNNQHQQQNDQRSASGPQAESCRKATDRGTRQDQRQGGRGGLDPEQRQIEKEALESHQEPIFVSGQSYRTFSSMAVTSLVPTSEN